MYGSLIREKRNKIGITQEELAQRICVVRTTISAWEAEKYPPTDARNIAALESSLGFESGELYKLLHGNPIPPSGTKARSPRAKRKERRQQ